MTTRAVNMAVRQLFLAGCAYIGYFDRKVQGLAGEWMVAVDEYLAVLDLGDGDVDLALRTTALELHAGLDVFDALERFARHFLHQLGVMHAITFLGRHVSLELVADGSAFHLLLQARNDLATAMQISQRIATFGAVDDLPLIVGQGVMEGGNGILGNLHNDLVAGFMTAGQPGKKRQDYQKRPNASLQESAGMAILRV